MHLFLLHPKKFSISNLLTIHSLLHQEGYIMEMGTADTSETEISEATHKYLIPNGYYISKMGICL